jgi:hypothetical protein
MMLERYSNVNPIPIPITPLWSSVIRTLIVCAAVSVRFPSLSYQHITIPTTYLLVWLERCPFCYLDSRDECFIFYISVAPSFFFSSTLFSCCANLTRTLFVVLASQASMQELHDRAEEGVALSEFVGWLARQYECRCSTVVYGTSIGATPVREQGKRLARVYIARAEVQAGTSFYVSSCVYKKSNLEIKHYNPNYLHLRLCSRLRRRKHCKYKHSRPPCPNADDCSCLTVCLFHF